MRRKQKGGFPALMANMQRAKRLANRGIAILLLGETGSGKEAFAKAIHDLSDRRHAPFVTLNCTAIPESLIESELFGYKEGAFAGGKSEGPKGKILQADGGTLFLHEIGDMPLPLQSRLLRALTAGEVLPLGAESSMRLDLNVICGSHRNLPEMVAAGEFREDLFYRLNGAVFQIPPLRERSDSSEVIAKLLAEEAHEAGSELQIAPAALARLAEYHWPGNIRQLRNALRYAVAMCDGDTLEVEHFPPEILSIVETPPGPGNTAIKECLSSFHPYTGSKAEERERMISVLRGNGWRISVSARQMGIPRATFYRHMQRFNIVSPNRADSKV